MDFQLEQGELLCLDGDGRGVDVHCLEGVLWLTQIGQDHILRGGDVLALSRSGKVVITALAPVTLRIAQAAAAEPVLGGWQLRLAPARV